MLSLLEGKKDNYNLNMIMKNLNMKILKQNLVDIFIVYKNIYGDREKDYVDKCF